MEKQVFIIDKSTIAEVETHKTGGHGYEFEESPITFIGNSNPPGNAVKVSMAPRELRDEIHETWERITHSSTEDRDI